jgi:prepilin-type N-terminal cleavage/methylation domain-containing protein
MIRRTIAFAKTQPEGARRTPLRSLSANAIDASTFHAARAFTLIEMLVVVGIIGIIASISLPAMKGIGQANLTAAANRQILDDLAYARLRAISDRTTVYMVFVPPNVGQLLNGNTLRPEDRRIVSNLVSSQYGGYALLSTRSVGDQPGQSTPRYLTEWKSLPEGMLIPPAKYNPSAAPPRAFGAAFQYRVGLPFPKSQSNTNNPLPFLAYNSRGQLSLGQDEFVPLVRGTIFFPRTADGKIDLTRAADVQTIPPKLATNDFQVVRVNWLTGRAKVETAEFRQ